MEEGARARRGKEKMGRGEVGEEDGEEGLEVDQKRGLEGRAGDGGGGGGRGRAEEEEEGEDAAGWLAGWLGWAWLGWAG